MDKTNMENELLALVKQFQIDSRVPHHTEIHINDRLQHLGMDSLGRAELFSRIEKKFSVGIPDTLLANAQTLQEIADYISQAAPRSLLHSKGKRYESHGEQPHVDVSKVETLLELPLLFAKHSPDKAHIYLQKEDGTEEIITNEKLLHMSLRVAKGLQNQGLKPGETVAIMLPTQPGFFYTFFGTLLAGGIPVPIYPPFRMHMLEAYAKVESRILKNAEVRILVTFDQAENLSRLLKTFVPSLKYVTTVEELLQEKQLADPFKAQSHHFAFIQYTSGSTSDPKGVLLSHANLLANIRAYGKAISVQPTDVSVSWLPLYHDMGLIAMWLGSLYFGIPLVLLTPFSFLNHPEKWLWAVHYHRGSLSGAPNFAYELCVRKIDPATIEGLDLSSWRIAANGAEKIYPKTLEQFAEKFAPYGFKKRALLPVYGLAESTVGLAIPLLDRDYRLDRIARKTFEEERKAIPSSESDTNVLTFVSCGRPIVGHEVRIVDDDQQVLPERHVGNLEFRGPSNMQGYFNNPRATAEIYHDGWLNSGDLAYLADNEVFITGRRKDLIIKAGRNLYPVEIEELVGAIPGIRQGCVVAFGLTDQVLGTEKLVIVAETRVKEEKKCKELIATISEQVATNLDIAPDDVVLVAPHTVPKTSSGKLQRAACKSLYLEKHLHKFHVPAWFQIVRLSAQGILKKCLSVLKGVAKLFYTFYCGLIVLLTFLPLYACAVLGTRNFTAKACQIWVKFLQIVTFNPTHVVGLENLEKNKAVIYAANHASYIDGLVLLAIVPINTRFIGKREILSTPIIRTFFKKLDYLFVDRFDFTQGVADTKQIEKVLKEGKSVVIFPEGTFSYAQGLRPFRLGAFKISADVKVPIIPIALSGTRFILRGDEKLMQPHQVAVTISKPMEAENEEWQSITALRDSVRAEIAKYCGEPSLDFIVAHTVAPKNL